MNAISPFKFDRNEIRIVMCEGAPWFVGKDVAECLGYTNPTKAIRDHCRGGSEMDLPTTSGTQTIKIIPESDVYRLVMRSNAPHAERFQDWVCEEVLPSIRKTGGYLTRDDEINRAAEIITKGLMPIVERISLGQIQLADRLEKTETTVSKLNATMENVVYDLRSVVDRRDPTTASKREHIDTIMMLGGKCPCCHTVDVIDKEGNKLSCANWDHWYRPNRRGVHEVWLVCQDCNQAMKDQEIRSSRHIHFEAYQAVRVERHRPMYKVFGGMERC